MDHAPSTMHPCEPILSGISHIPAGGRMEPFKDATRSNTGLLAGAEKRVLLWIAARLPAWVTSDHLTGLGFVALVMVGASFALSSRLPAMLWWVVFWLSVNWFGDSLDGTVARVRRQLRPRYG